MIEQMLERQLEEYVEAFGSDAERGYFDSTREAMTLGGKLDAATTLTAWMLRAQIKNPLRLVLSLN
jgi:hypothetical protein